ncbi:LysR family transcriptional regulator [Allorhizobium borbori]|uniref:HTH-type transcriptional regulator TtuA n=1 Tax=Allorhizobium borbori TaxID=485907 RepID=A0A7W6P2A5_9HYPH|nr:LysR family transcriptional regulator [Allorhizobium borbori]MBB4103644.1 DNA-binding transcriptional LysR family regulator [Allorhizobium borbori]
MDYRSSEMAVFSAVAEAGGFSAAGRRLHLTPSAVSKLIARLEDRLGTPLFTRSTRRLQLTAEGVLYLERVRRILAEMDEADRLVGSGAGAVPRGRLRVSASVAFGECCILPLAPEFLALYPQVELDISLTDAVVDLVDDRTDIAIRIGALRDSSLKARKLLETRRVIIAAPEYIERHGLPRVPQDLATHNCLRFNFRRTLDEWPFRDPQTGATFTVAIAGNAHGNNGVILRHLALSGLGLARLGSFHVADDIAAGRLVAILEDYNPGDIELIHAVYVGHEQLALRVRAFIDFIADRIGKS